MIGHLRIATRLATALVMIALPELHQSTATMVARDTRAAIVAVAPTSAARPAPLHAIRGMVGEVTLGVSESIRRIASTRVGGSLGAGWRDLCRLEAGEAALLSPLLRTEAVRIVSAARPFATNRAQIQRLAASEIHGVFALALPARRAPRTATAPPIPAPHLPAPPATAPARRPLTPQDGVEVFLGGGPSAPWAHVTLLLAPAQTGVLTDTVAPLAALTPRASDVPSPGIPRTAAMLVGGPVRRSSGEGGNVDVGARIASGALQLAADGTQLRRFFATELRSLYAAVLPSGHAARAERIPAVHLHAPGAASRAVAGASSAKPDATTTPAVAANAATVSIPEVLRPVPKPTQHAPWDRDPFAAPVYDLPAVAGSARSRPPGLAGLDIDQIEIQAVALGGPYGAVALAVDADKHTYFLRTGSELYNGRVVRVEPNGVVFVPNYAASGQTVPGQAAGQNEVLLRVGQTSTGDHPK